MKNFILIFIVSTTINCKTPKPKSSQDLNVLFIGNSLTYFYEMPQTLQIMLNETKSNINVDQSTFPGYSLSAHLSNKNDSIGKKLIITKTEKKIVEKKWDVIILQTGTVSVLIPENRKLKVNKAVYAIKELVTNPNCEFILFNTWPSKKEYPKKYCYSARFISKSLDEEKDYCSPTITNLEEEINLINESYDFVAKSNKINKSDNGNKFYEIITHHPEIELYDDHIHPNINGAFLNACIFYQMLTGKKASELEYDGEIKPKTAKLLKQVSGI